VTTAAPGGLRYRLKPAWWVLLGRTVIFRAHIQGCIVLDGVHSTLGGGLTPPGPPRVLARENYVENKGPAQ
jgi:hypothetical protein